jgi:dihydroflavonol-4-reductase
MILITGATGFIGRSLTKTLLRKGHGLRLLSRDPIKTKKEFPKAEVFHADLSDPKSLKGVAKGIDTIIHLAGMVSYSKSREEIFSSNSGATKNLLAECRNVKRFIFSSSVSVYGEAGGKVDERHQTRPKTFYGKSKLECERMIRKSGIPSVILRIAPVYGVGSPNWKKNLRLLARGFPIPNTKNLTHVVHVSDVVQAVVKSIKKGEGAYNIADKKPIPFLEFAGSLMKLLGKKPRKMPAFLVKVIAKPFGMRKYLDVLTINRYYIIKKAERELGYRPRAELRKEARKMVEWYRGL